MGVRYGLERAGWGFALEKADGTLHEVEAEPDGPARCSCPDFRFRHAGLPTHGCRHVRALRAVGLLPPLSPATLSPATLSPVKSLTMDHDTMTDLAAFGLAPIRGGAPFPGEGRDDGEPTMAINFEETVKVEIPANPHVRSKDRDSSKFWAKTVESVDAKASTGNDWSGEWLTRGSMVDLPIGSLFVNANVIDGNYKVSLRVVMPHGKSWVIEGSDSKAWAQELRKAARKWIDMSPAGRIVAASKGYLAETEGRKDEPTYAAARKLREGWLAELEDPADPKAAAIATIRSLMAEHGISIADLG